MRLHVMVSLLLCGLVNFLNGSRPVQPKIVRPNPTTVVAYQINTKYSRLPVRISERFTLTQFALTEALESKKEADDSDLESNGTGSVATSPAMSPQPQPVLEQSLFDPLIIRKESFPELNGRMPLSTSGRSLDELGSPWNKSGSGFADHPIPTPKKDDDCTDNHRLSTPNAPADRHPVPTPEKK